MNRMFEALKAVTYLTQVALTMLIPIVLCIWGSNALRGYFDLGGWVVVVGALIGTLAGFQGLMKLGMEFQKQGKKKDTNKEEDGERNHDEDDQGI